MLHRTLVAFAAAVALGCVPVATNALAAGHPSGHATARGSSGHVASRGGHVAGGYAGGYRGRYAGGRGPIYNSYGGDYTGCSGYSYGYGYYAYVYYCYYFYFYHHYYLHHIRLRLDRF